MSDNELNQGKGCPATDVIQRVADQAASVEDTQAVMKHLDTCEACRARFDELLHDEQETQDLRGAYAETLAAEHREAPPAADADVGEAPPAADADVSEAEFRIEDGRVVLSNGLRLAPPREERYLARLGPYDVVAILGHGGMGVVFRAWEASLSRQVCLKVIHPRLGDDPAARERFLHEARMAAKLNHPNIVTIYAVGEDGEVAFIAMEHVAGESLSRLIEAEAPLGAVQAARIAHQVLLGLEHAHAKGIIHRDVKPANVLIEANTLVVKLVDFGLARGVSEDVVPGRVGTVAGTVAYMSPEQTAGEQDLDARSDLFSVGAMLFEMLSGAMPFAGKDAREIIGQIRQAAAPDLAELNPSLPLQLRRIVQKALEKDRSRRYQHAGDFAGDLRLFIEKSAPPTALAGAGAPAGAGAAGDSAEAELDALAALRQRTSKEADRDFRERFARCSVCSNLITSRLGVAGACEVCGAPICYRCLETRNERRCSAHAGQAAAAAQAQPARDGQAAGKPPVVPPPVVPPPGAAPLPAAGRPVPVVPQPPSPLSPGSVPRPGAAPQPRQVTPPEYKPTPPATPAEIRAKVAAKVAEARAQGRPAISGPEAQLAEKTFLRMVANSLSRLKKITDPLTGEQLGVRSWAKLADRGDKASPSRKGPPGAPTKARGFPSPSAAEVVYDVTKRGFAKVKARVVVKARFLARLDAFAAEGFDDQGVTGMELEEVLNGITRSAAEADAWHLVILGSATPWTPEAVELVAGGERRPFRDPLVSVVLCDGPRECWILDETDEKLASCRDAFWAEVTGAELAPALELVREYLTAHRVIALETFLREMKLRPLAGTRLFKALGAAGEFVLEEMDEVGMVLYLKT